MFENFISRVFAHYLRNYVKNFNPEQLKFGIWSGDLVLDRLELDPESLEPLALPCVVKLGFVGRLQLKVPWARLLGRSPIVVVLERVFLVIAPRGKSISRDVLVKRAEMKALHKRKRLEAVEALKERAGGCCAATTAGPTASCATGSPTRGFLIRLATRLLDKLQLVIRSVHVRYEDPSERPFAFGLTLGDFTIQSVESAVTELINKTVCLRNLAMYFDAGGLSHTVKTVADLESKRDVTYLLRPLQVTVRAQVDPVPSLARPPIQLQAEIRSVDICLRENQYGALFSACNYFANQGKYQKYLRFRPPLPVAQDPLAWFRYAGKCVLSDIHNARHRLAWKTIFELKEDRDEYILLYKRKLGKALWLPPLEDDEHIALKELEDRLALDQILFFRSLAEAELGVEMRQRQESMERLAKSSSFSSSWFDFWKGKPTPLEEDDPAQLWTELSPKEKEELYASVRFDPKRERHCLQLPPEACFLQARVTVSEFGFTLNRFRFTGESSDYVHIEGRNIAVHFQKLVAATHIKTEIRVPSLSCRIGEALAYVEVDSLHMELQRDFHATRVWGSVADATLSNVMRPGRRAVHGRHVLFFGPPCNRSTRHPCGCTVEEEEEEEKKKKKKKEPIAPITTPALTFDLRLYAIESVRFPGYRRQVSMTLNSPRLIFLDRFLTELSLYFREATVSSNMLTDMSRKATHLLKIHLEKLKKSRSPARVTLRLTDVDCQMPRNSQSTEYIGAGFDFLAFSNVSRNVVPFLIRHDDGTWERRDSPASPDEVDDDDDDVFVDAQEEEEEDEFFDAEEEEEGQKEKEEEEEEEEVFVDAYESEDDLADELCDGHVYKSDPAGRFWIAMVQGLSVHMAIVETEGATCPGPRRSLLRPVDINGIVERIQPGQRFRASIGGSLVHLEIAEEEYTFFLYGLRENFAEGKAVRDRMFKLFPAMFERPGKVPERRRSSSYGRIGIPNWEELLAQEEQHVFVFEKVSVRLDILRKTGYFPDGSKNTLCTLHINGGHVDWILLATGFRILTWAEHIQLRGTSSENPLTFKRVLDFDTDPGAHPFHFKYYKRPVGDEWIEMAFGGPTVTLSDATVEIAEHIIQTQLQPLWDAKRKKDPRARPSRISKKIVTSFNHTRARLVQDHRIESEDVTALIIHVDMLFDHELSEGRGVWNKFTIHSADVHVDSPREQQYNKSYYLLEPITGSIDHNIVNSTTFLPSQRQLVVDVDPLVFNFSYLDVKLLRGIALFLIQSISTIVNLVPKIEDQPHPSLLRPTPGGRNRRVSDLREEHRNRVEESEVDEDMLIHCQHIRISFLNDLRNAVVPMLSAASIAPEILVNRKSHKTVIEIKTAIQTCFYNQANVAWEPLLELWRVHVKITVGVSPRLSVSLRSSELLNLNVTHGLLITAIDAVDVFRKIWPTTDRQDSDSRFFSSYWVTNDTGMRLQFHSDSDKLPTRMLSGREIPIHLDRGGKKKLIQDLLAPRAPPTIDVTVEDLACEPLHMIPIARVSTMVYPLKFEHGTPPDLGPAPRLVVEVALRESSKHVDVHSVFTIHNKCGVPLELRLRKDRLPATPFIEIGEIASESSIHVPLLYAEYRVFSLRPSSAFGWSEDFVIENDAKKERNLLLSHGAPSFFTSLHVTCTPDGRVDALLSAPLIIENLLAEVMDYRLTGEKSNTPLIQSSLSRGGSALVHEFDPSSMLKLSVRVSYTNWSDSVVVCSKSESKLAHKIKLLDTEKRRLTLHIENTQPQGKTRRVILYASHWMINKTGLRLFYRQRDSSSISGNRIPAGTWVCYENKKHQATIRCNECGKLYCDACFESVHSEQGKRGHMRRPLMVGEASQSEESDGGSSWDGQSSQTRSLGDIDSSSDYSAWECGERTDSAPFMFGFQGGDIFGKKISIRANESKWSNPQGVNTVGTVAPFHVSEKKHQKSAPRKRYELTMSVDLAPGVFQRTKIVTFTPRYVAHNDLKGPLFLRQAGSEQALELKPGTRLPWHWHDKLEESLVQIRTGSHIEWSGKFGVAELGDFVLKMVNCETRDVTYVRVEVKLHTSIVYIVFSEEDMEHPPYRIENLCQRERILFHQKDVDLWDELHPGGDAVVFTWDEPTCPHSLVVEVIGPSKGEVNAVQVQREYNPNIIRSYAGIKVGEYRVYPYIRADGPTKVLVFSNTRNPFTQVEEEEAGDDEEDSNRMVREHSDTDSKNQLAWLFEGGRLQVTVVRARGVKKCDPYVKVSCERQNYRTKAVRVKGPSDRIEWDTAFAFIVTDPDAIIRARIVDKRLGSDKEFGLIEIPLSVFETEGVSHKEGWFVLRRPDKEKVAGELYLSMDWEFGAIVEKKTDLVLDIDIPGVGISVVDKTPQELLYIALLGIRMDMAQSQTNNNVEVIVSDFQIDNQLFNAHFRVLLAPSSDVLEEKRDVFHLTFVKSYYSPMVAYYKYFSVLLQELTVFIEEDIILHVLNMALDVVGAAESLKDDSISEVTSTSASLHADPHGIASCKVYFELFHFHPIKINITMSINPRPREELLNSSFRRYLRLLGLTPTNVDNAPLRLNTLVLEHAFVQEQTIRDRIVGHYVRQIVSETYKILGSMDFLGNPVGLVGGLAEGVMDFFYEPAMGLVKSPADFGKGVAKGTINLVRKSLFGAFNAASKVSGSASKALALLSFDDQFLQNRGTSQTSAPKHAVDGVAQGIATLGKGVLSGVTGVLTQPVLGAKKRGFEGFLKGVGKGIMGLPVKPVVGLLDLASKTTEGLRNTTTLFTHHKPKRVRRPRAFSPDGVLKMYSESEADAVHLLCKLHRKKHREESYVYHIAIDSYTLFVTDKRLLYVKRKDIEWEIALDEVRAIEPSVNEVVIRTFDDDKGKRAQPGFRTIPCPNQRSTNALHTQLTDYINSRRIDKLPIPAPFLQRLSAETLAKLDAKSGKSPRSVQEM